MTTDDPPDPAPNEPGRAHPWATATERPPWSTPELTSSPVEAVRAQLIREQLHSIHVGDVVVRLLAGKIPMPLTVTAVTHDLITCGIFGWTFDRDTGAEVDAVLDWGPPPKTTGSVLVIPAFL